MSTAISLFFVVVTFLAYSQMLDQVSLTLAITNMSLKTYIFPNPLTVRMSSRLSSTIYSSGHPLLIN